MRTALAVVVTMAFFQPGTSTAQSEAKAKADAKAKDSSSTPARKTATGEEIRKLIDSLADLTDPVIGLSPTLTGSSFAPVAGSEQVSVGMLTNHGIKPSKTILRLVEQGPQAMPFLLKALDDKRPTKLNVRSSFDFGHDNETYTIKIGDVCYVAFGQITGNSYSVVHYIPSGIVGIYSPTEHPELVKRVRMDWSRDDLTQALSKKLLADNDFMRLLYYFPGQSAANIADRLQRLYAESPGGVRTRSFIIAVIWSKEPHIRQVLTDIYRRTTNPDMFLLVLPAVEGTDAKSAGARIGAFLAKLPQSENSETGDGYELLIALAKRDGNDAKPAFKKYLENASLQRRSTMCRVLREVQKDWAIEFLTPMLTDKRTGCGGVFFVKYDASKWFDEQLTLRVRLCDEAAETISKNNPGMSFTMAGQYEHLDRQIEVLRKQIAARNP